MYHNPWQQWPQGVGATTDFAVASTQPAVGLGLVGLPAQASTGMDYQQQLQYGAQFSQFQAQGVPVGFGQWPAWGASEMSQWAGQFPAATAMVPGMAVPDSGSQATSTTTIGQTTAGKTDSNTATSKAGDSTSLMSNQWAASTYSYGQQQAPPPITAQQGAAWGQVGNSSSVTSATWTSQPPPPPPAQPQSQGGALSSTTDVSGNTSKLPGSSQVDSKMDNQSGASKDPKQGTTSTDEEEQAFEQHFKDWEGQFQSWREQNKNHPDKEAYQRYENQWQEWRQQLLARREQMRSKKSLGSSDTQGDTQGKVGAQSDLLAAGVSSTIKAQEGMGGNAYGQLQSQALASQAQNTSGLPGMGLVGSAVDSSGMGLSALGTAALDPTAMGYSGMSPSGMSVGLGAAAGALGSRPGQAGVVPGIGLAMSQPGFGPGMVQAGIGLAMAQPGLTPGMGLGIGQTPMAPGMPPGMGLGMSQPGMGLGMGPGMNQPGMVPGLDQGMSQPGMGLPGTGPGMGTPGMGQGAGPKGMGPSGMDQQGVGRMYPNDEPYNRFGEKPGWDRGQQQQNRNFDRMDNWKDERPWDKPDFPNQQHPDMMRQKQMGDWNQGGFGKDEFSGSMDSRQSRSGGFDNRMDFPGSNDRMRDWNRGGPDAPSDRFSGGRDRWNQMDEGPRNQRGPMGDQGMDSRSWNKPEMDLPGRSNDRPPWNRDGDYPNKPGFEGSDSFDDRDRMKRSEFDRKGSKFPVDFPEKAPEEYGMWPGEDEWNAEDNEEPEKKEEDPSNRDDWDGKGSRFGDSGMRGDDWRDRDRNDRSSRGWQNQDDKGGRHSRDGMEPGFRQSGFPDEPPRWERDRSSGPRSDRWQENFGGPDGDRRQGPYSDQRGRDGDQRGRDFDQRGGRDFEQRGRDFDNRGRDGDQRGRDFDRGRDLDQRGRDGDQRRRDGDQRPPNQDPKGNFNKGGPQFGGNSRGFQDGRQQDMGLQQGGKGQFDQGPPGNFQRPFGPQDSGKPGDQSQSGPPFPDSRGRPDMPFNQDMQNRFGPNRGGPQQPFPQDSKGDRMNRPPFMDEKGRQDMPFNQGGMGMPFNQEAMGNFKDKDDFPNRGPPFGQEPGFNQQGGPNQRRNEDMGGPFGDRRGGHNQQGRFGPGGNFQQDSQGPFGNDKPGFNQGPPFDKPNDPQAMFGQGGPMMDNQRFDMPNDPKQQFGPPRGNSRFDSPRDPKQQGPQFGQGPMSKDGPGRFDKPNEGKPPFGPGGPKDDFGHVGPRNEPPRFDRPMDGRRGPPDSRFGDNQGFDRPGPGGPPDSNKGRFGPGDNQNRMQGPPFRPNEQANKMQGASPGHGFNQEGKLPVQSKNTSRGKDDSGFCGDLDVSFDKWNEEPISQKKHGPGDVWQEKGDNKMKSPANEPPGNKMGGNDGPPGSSPARRRVSKWGPVEDSKAEQSEGPASNQSPFVKPPTPPHMVLKSEEASANMGQSSEPTKPVSSSPVQPKNEQQFGDKPGPDQGNQERRGPLLGAGPPSFPPPPPRPGGPPPFGAPPQSFQGPRPQGPRGPRPPLGNQVRPGGPGGPFGLQGGPGQPPGGSPQLKGLLPTPNQAGGGGGGGGGDGLLPTPGPRNEGLLPTPNEKTGQNAAPTPPAQKGPPNQSPTANKSADQKSDVAGKKPLLPPPSTPKAGEIDITKNPFLTEKEQEMLMKATEEIKEIQKFKDRMKGMDSGADPQAQKTTKPEEKEVKEDVSKGKQNKDDSKSPAQADRKSDQKTSGKDESKEQAGSSSKEDSAKVSEKSSQDSRESQKSDSKGDSKASGSKDRGSDRGSRDSDRYSRDRDRDRERDRDTDGGRDQDRRRDHDSDRGGRGRNRAGGRGGFGHGNEPDFRGGDSKMHPDDPFGPGKRRYPFNQEEEFHFGRHPGGNQFNNLQQFENRMFQGPLGMEPGGNRRMFREVDYGHRTAESVLGHTFNEALSSFANYGNVDIFSGPSFSKASVETYDYVHGKIREPELIIDDRYLHGTYDAFTSVKEGQQAFLEQQALERPRERIDYHDDYPRYKEKPKHDFEKYDIEKSYDSPRSRGSEKELKEKSNPCLFPSAREQHPEVITITDLLCPPGRNNRPVLLVIILRGPPGSGKTHLAKLIKDQEIENGGTAPRMLCLDDYFMVESERTVQDPETGKRVKAKEFKYEYEAEMEDTYRQSLLKVFKKTVDDKFFPFIIVDSVNMKTKHYEEFCVHAKQKGFQVYIGDMDCMEPVICHKRNVHKRSLEDIMRTIDGWDATPSYFHRVDMKPLLQELSIPDVEMEEQTEEPVKDSADDDTAETENLGHVPSKWETMEATDSKLDRLDGLCGPKRKHSSMEDYLQLPDDYAQRKSQPGKKRVRWADIEEHKEQDRLRAIGFVVGQTDWDKLTDPTHADRALTRTKYF